MRNVCRIFYGIYSCLSRFHLSSSLLDPETDPQALPTLVVLIVLLLGVVVIRFSIPKALLFLNRSYWNFSHIAYNLRNRPHNRQLPVPERSSRLVDCNFIIYHCWWIKIFIIRMLYHNMYCLIDFHTILFRFYRAMHFSAYARSWDRMSSVRPSVCLSVCDVGGLWSHRLEVFETNCTSN